MGTSKLQVEIRRDQFRGPSPPIHHVMFSPDPGWLSPLTLRPPPTIANAAENSTKTVGFRNPWPSWHKPTLGQVWNNLEWGQPEPDPCVELASSHLEHIPATQQGSSPPLALNRRPAFASVNDPPDSLAAQAVRLLKVEDPDFSPLVNTDTKAKVTWLGHAGVLVQLPQMGEQIRPFSCLFDPIFSMRCSPSQVIGPVRSYPPPCGVESLPAIDAVCISHNHYDHLDLDTVTKIWKIHHETVHFFVPLGNREWFITCGIPKDRVVELDWWDSAWLYHIGSAGGCRIYCTPAQHSSVRTGSGVNAALWSSWYLEHQQPDAAPYRVFFGGDTGFQFHDSPNWPPRPNQREGVDELEDNKFPACPAFEQIRDRLGPPHLLLLPVSVGATYSYIRSLVYLPDWISPIPRHSPGLSAATHMPAWDAVRVLKLMAGKKSGVCAAPSEQDSSVAVAIHWGTFVQEPVEVLKTLGQLEWACQKQGAKFARSLPANMEDGELCFLALNHGQTVQI